MIFNSSARSLSFLVSPTLAIFRLGVCTHRPRHTHIHERTRARVLLVSREEEKTPGGMKQQPKDFLGGCCHFWPGRFGLKPITSSFPACCSLLSPLLLLLLILPPLSLRFCVHVCFLSRDSLGRPACRRRDSL